LCFAVDASDEIVNRYCKLLVLSPCCVPCNSSSFHGCSKLRDHKYLLYSSIQRFTGMQFAVRSMHRIAPAADEAWPVLRSCKSNTAVKYNHGSAGYTCSRWPCSQARITSSRNLGRISDPLLRQCARNSRSKTRQIPMKHRDPDTPFNWTMESRSPNTCLLGLACWYISARVQRYILYEKGIFHIISG
jgi:hypothetical protein